LAKKSAQEKATEEQERREDLKRAKKLLKTAKGSAAENVGRRIRDLQRQ
jgi:hypothetical protein